LRVLVEHMILSHHGRLEFGSPKVPQFPEALLLHYLDDLDSKMECMRALVENDRQLEGCFTSYSSALERTVLKLDRYIAPGPTPTSSMPPVGQVANLRPIVNRPATTTEKSGVEFEAPAQHPLFAPKPESIFADKLRQALKPATAEQER